MIAFLIVMSPVVLVSFTRSVATEPAVVIPATATESTVTLSTVVPSNSLMKIAPLVVYLGSDKAAGISGQIFSVRNNEIFLFNQNRPIRVIHRGDGWTPEKIDAQLKGAFGPSLTPLDRSGEVFSWDPI